VIFDPPDTQSLSFFPPMFDPFYRVFLPYPFFRSGFSRVHPFILSFGPSPVSEILRFYEFTSKFFGNPPGFPILNDVSPRLAVSDRFSFLWKRDFSLLMSGLRFGSLPTFYRNRLFFNSFSPALVLHKLRGLSVFLGSKPSFPILLFFFYILSPLSRSLFPRSYFLFLFLSFVSV